MIETGVKALTEVLALDFIGNLGTLPFFNGHLLGTQNKAYFFNKWYCKILEINVAVGDWPIDENKYNEFFIKMGQ